MIDSPFPAPPPARRMFLTDHQGTQWFDPREIVRGQIKGGDLILFLRDGHAVSISCYRPGMEDLALQLEDSGCGAQARALRQAIKIEDKRRGWIEAAARDRAADDPAAATA